MPDSPPVPDASGPLRRAVRAMSRVRRGGLALFSLLLFACVIPAQPGHAEPENLPLPRYAALKSNEVNLRSGPGEERPKLWVYQRAGMPVQIFEEWDTWRRIR